MGVLQHSSAVTPAACHVSIDRRHQTTVSAKQGTHAQLHEWPHSPHFNAHAYGLAVVLFVSSQLEGQMYSMLLQICLRAAAEKQVYTARPPPTCHYQRCRLGRRANLTDRSSNCQGPQQACTSLSTRRQMRFHRLSINVRDLRQGCLTTASTITTSRGDGAWRPMSVRAGYAM